MKFLLCSAGQHPCLQGSSKALATVTAIIDGTGSVGEIKGGCFVVKLSRTGRMLPSVNRWYTDIRYRYPIVFNRINLASIRCFL